MNLLKRIARSAAYCAALGMLAGLSGCAALSEHYYENHGHGDKYLDASNHSDLNTIGIESADLRGACGEAVSGLLGSPAFAGYTRPPVIIVADCCVINESDNEFDTKALVDLLRSELVQNAEGRLHLLAEGSDCCSKDSTCKADLEIRARITEVAQSSGSHTESYTQIAFEAVHPQSNEVVFANLHSFKKAGQSTPALY